VSFYLLPNTIGSAATSLDNAGSGSTASGFNIKDLIAGPRSSMWRSVASSGAVRAGYHVAADTTVTHMVDACRMLRKELDWRTSESATFRRERDEARAEIEFQRKCIHDLDRQNAELRKELNSTNSLLSEYREKFAELRRWKERAIEEHPSLEDLEV
jgi:hypothetical protein